jgi:outer membrane protein assembly factor BamB
MNRAFFEITASHEKKESASCIRPVKKNLEGMKKNQTLWALAGIILGIMAIVSCKKTDSIAKFRADASNSGVYTEKSPSKINSVAWKFKTNGVVFSSPVVSENTVYVGSNDSCLYALNSSDGQLKWKFKTGGTVSSSALVYQETVYFVSFDGNLYALDAKTGQKKWNYSGGPEKQYTNHGIHGLQPKNEMMADPWDMYLSSPAIYKNKVFFGSGNGKFFAVDARTGKEVWNYASSDVIHSSPAIYEDMVIFGGWDTYLHALNTETGK